MGGRLPPLGRRVREASIMGHVYKVLAVVILGVVLAACGASTNSGAQTEVASSNSGDRAPDFEIRLYQGGDVLGGDTVRVSELLGTSKPILLNFWAGLCPPCRIEMPELQRVYEARHEEMILSGWTSVHSSS